MPNITRTRGTAQNLLTTELNSLANNSNAVHASSVAITSSGFVSADLELLVQFGTNPTANTAISVWLLRETDGTNFEEGSASITPTRVPDAIFSVRAVVTAQRMIRQVDLQPGNLRALVRNDGTGQALAASGNVLSIRPYTESF